MDQDERDNELAESYRADQDLEHQANAENKIVGGVYEAISADIDGNRIIEVVKETLDENGVTYHDH